MSIQNYLNQIKSAVFGKDVRQSIHDAIKQCYDDASIDHDNANMEVKLARGSHDTLNERFTSVEENIKNNSEQLDNIENKIVELKADKTGQTDISEILKTCIEKANTEHKNVFIPKGDYKIDKIVELLDINNVSIECEIGTKFIVNLTDIDLSLIHI